MVRTTLLLFAVALPFVALPAVAQDADSLRREGAARAAAREFAAAAEAFARVRAAGAAGRDADAADGRAEDCRLAAEGLAHLVAEVNRRRERFVAVTWGSGKVPHTLTAADGEGFSASLPGGSTRLRWGSVEAAAFPALVERAQPGGGDFLICAALLRETGSAEAAEVLLVRHLEGGGDAARVSALFARWCGERRVPEGGYVVHEGRLLTVEDRDRALLEGRLAGFHARVADGSPSERAAAVEALLALGEPARWTLLKGLYAARDRLARELAASRPVQDPRTKAFLKEELARRREAALKFIEDAKAYPYPSPDHAGQAEVDRLVAEVRLLWDDPVQALRALHTAVDGILAEGEAIEALLARHEEGHAADPARLRGAANAVLDLRGMVADPHDAKVLAYNAKVRTTADAEERDNVTAVNEYRIMLGRGALKMDERLLRAARGHSRHMRLHNYFAHESPVPGMESPGQRAAKQGYGGGVGENISMGRATGRGAFDAWFHSSGHHRNMVGRRWTEMGCGRSGTHFTQLFGAATGKSLDEPAALPPPGPDVAPEPLPPPDATGEEGE